MDGDRGPFDVPDFWRASAFSLSDTPGETLFTDTPFGESDALPARPMLIKSQNCP